MPSAPKRTAVRVLALIVCVAAPALAQAQEPSLLDVLVRTTTHVDELLSRLSGTVAEERYWQRTRLPGLRGGTVLERSLVSDYLIVHPDGADRHYGFRDVFEVDGRPVRDRQERLVQLFLNPTLTSDRRIQGILRESARYNLGEVDRTINSPTLALIFLSSNYKLRFAFERTTDAAPRLELEGPDLPADTYVVAYREDWPTTVIRRAPAGGRVPAQGRFWLEPATGRVLMSELALESAAWGSVIAARYRPDEQMGHDVPVEMRERYDHRRTTSRIDGTATYRNYREFQVIVSEAEPFR